jgi:tRNA 2-thiouridine synthesizing protein E
MEDYEMGQLTENWLHEPATSSTSNFPDAPDGWEQSMAEAHADQLGVRLNDDHWDLVRALQSYFDSHESPNRRELNDALEERFHAKGGRRYLYQLFPGGPVAQGCQLAGVQAPSGNIDLSFGSAV